MKILLFSLIIKTSIAKCIPTNLVTFGDSFSDIGNIKTLSNNTWPTYGDSFSNGLIWNEIISEKLNFHLESFAYGGATVTRQNPGFSGPKSNIPVPSVDSQIQAFISKPFVKNSVFVTWAGGNDIFFYQELSGIFVASQMIENIVVLQRYTKGKGKYFVFTLPPLEMLPYFKDSDQALKNVYKNFAVEYNKTIKESSLKFGYNVVDVHSLLLEMIADPIRFGFKEEQNQGCAERCNRPNDYIFWDLFHFTERANGHFANLFHDTFAASNE